MTVELHQARRSALAEQVQNALRIDHTQSDPIVSARNALGVALPLVIGALDGNAALGLAACIGALQTAFSDRPGPYRLRLLRMTGCALAAGVTTGLAVAFSRSDAASIVLLLVLAFVTGLLLAFGPSAAQVGVAATGCALLLGHVPQPASAGVHAGLLVLAGGAAQVVLAVAAWPLGRHAPERRALAGLYEGLAGLARRLPSTTEGPPLSEQLVGVRATLFGLGHDHGPSTEAYRVLLDEAERIRREVIVLSGQVERLDREAPRAAQAVRGVLATAATVLSAVSTSLLAGRPVGEDGLGPVRAEVRRVVAELDGDGDGDGELTRRAASARVSNLLGQLRAAVETTRAGASEGVAGDRPRRVPGRGAARLRSLAVTVRANLNPNSALLRHSVRLAVLVAGSDLVVRWAGFGHGYWVALTILVVLRPDFGTTFQRGLMRVLGTIVGLLLATGLVHFIPGGQWWQVVLATAFFFGMRLAGPGNVGLSAVGLSAFVVVLLALDGVPPHTTIADRSLDTVIGGALALAATLLWPVWERSLLPGRLADLLAAYRRYLLIVLDPAANPGWVQQGRAACRLARGNVRASLDRARAEPVPARSEIELGEAVLVHTHRFVNAMLTMDAVRHTLHAAGDLPGVDELMRQAVELLGRCEEAVRTGHTSTSLKAGPGLRPAQEQVARALAEDPSRLGDVQTAGAVMDSTDRIANSLDTLADELRRQLPA